ARVATVSGVGPSFVISIDSSMLADGSHDVHFIAYDIYGVPGDVHGNLVADNTAPTGIFVATGQQRGPIGFSVQNASDTHGVAKVEFSLAWVLNPLHYTCTNASCVVYWSPCGNQSCNVNGTEFFGVTLTDTWGNARS